MMIPVVPFKITRFSLPNYIGISEVTFSKILILVYLTYCCTYAYLYINTLETCRKVPAFPTRSICFYNISAYFRENELKFILFHVLLKQEFLQVVGNKVKGRILKWVFQEKKARQIFRKRKFLTP